MNWSEVPRRNADIIEKYTLPLPDIAALCCTTAARTNGGHVLDVRFAPDGALNILTSIWFMTGDDALPDNRSVFFHWVDGAPVATVLEDIEKPPTPENPGGVWTNHFHPILTDDGIVHLAAHLTAAVFTPIRNGKPSPHQHLALAGTAPRVPARPEEASGIARIPQASFPTYSNGLICVPTTTTHAATSYGFLRHDVGAGTLAWQDWPAPKAPGGGLFGFFRKPGTTAPDIRQIGAQHGLEALEAIAATEDGVLIHSAGSLHNIKYGDDAVAVLHLSGTGEVRWLLYEDYRPDGGGGKKYGLRPRFAQDGQRVMLRSSYKSTDPFKGGTGLIDAATGAISMIDMPRGFRGAEIYAMRGDRALIAKSFTRGADLSFALCALD